MNNNKNAFYLDSETPQQIKNILEDNLHTKNRVRLFFGDKNTGKDWEEEYDTIGYIGRSTGTNKIPLLINNSRSMGGMAISTTSIVKVTVNGYTAYQHPNYHHGKHEVKESDLPEYKEMVLRDGENVARFKKSGQAAKWVDFIGGKRNSK
jgi:hypothetical protein